MIYTDTIVLNGRQYDYTYSDKYYIERDGALYIAAIDPLSAGRIYSETNILLPDRDITTQEALDIIMGVQK